MGLKAVISNLIYRKLKQLRGAIHGHTWGMHSSFNSALRKVVGLFEFQPNSHQMGSQLIGEVEWDEFAVVWDENLLGLNLEVMLMEEGRMRKKTGSRVRGQTAESVEGSRQVEKEREGHA